MFDSIKDDKWNEHLNCSLTRPKEKQKNESCPSTSLKWTRHIDKAIPSTPPSQYNQYLSADSDLMQQLEETRDHHNAIRVIEAYVNGAFPYAQIG